MANQDRSFVSDFKRFFGRGLAVLLPSVLTLWILVQAYFFVDARVAEPINRGIRQVVTWAIPQLLPADKYPEWFVVTDQELAAAERGATRLQLRARDFSTVWDGHWYLRFTGLIVAVVLIYLAGLLLGGFIGRRVYLKLESLLIRIPVVSLVYPHVKQVVELVLGDRPMAFRRVVLVEYPRKGIWTMAFVTSDSIKEASEVSGTAMLALFVPSTPAPFTGFTISVPASEVIELPISIDEAIRFVITGGMLVPGKETADTIVEVSGSTSQQIGDSRDKGADAT